MLLVSSYYEITSYWENIWHGLVGYVAASGAPVKTLVAHVVQSIFDTPVHARVEAEQYEEQ